MSRKGRTVDIVEKLRKMSFACDHNRSVGDCSIAPKEYVALSGVLTDAADEIDQLRKERDAFREKAWRYDELCK